MFEFKFGGRKYIPKEWLEVKPKVINTNIPIYIGSRVHLNSRNGTYVVTFYNETYARITCNTWTVQKARGLRDASHQMILRSDIKCLHGHDNFRR